jgi:hypothetical protein
LRSQKSTLRGKPYQTGGGRTVDANVIEIMMTWMVNNDKEFLLGGSAAATKKGTKTFPYQASPNSELQTVADSVNLAASPDQVWALVGQFGGMWHPLIASIKLTGEGVGQLRRIETAAMSRANGGRLAIGATRRAFLEAILVSAPSSRLGVARPEFAVSGDPAKRMDVVANGFGFFGRGWCFGSTFALEIYRKAIPESKTKKSHQSGKAQSPPNACMHSAGAKQDRSDGYAGLACHDQERIHATSNFSGNRALTGKPKLGSRQRPSHTSDSRIGEHRERGAQEGHRREHNGHDAHGNQRDPVRRQALSKERKQDDCAEQGSSRDARERQA